MRPCLFLSFYIFFLFSFCTLLLLRDRHHERWEELRLEKGKLERTGLNLHPDILTAGVPRLGKAKFIVTQSLPVSGSLLLEQKLLFSLRFGQCSHRGHTGQGRHFLMVTTWSMGIPGIQRMKARSITQHPPPPFQKCMWLSTHRIEKPRFK